MSDATAPERAPLDETMLAMDVADTLRHRQGQPAAGVDEAALIADLRSSYGQQGIEVSDAVLREGMAALAENRFGYTPPPTGLTTQLARVYVSRGSWGPPVRALALMLGIALGGYFLVYQPFRESLAERARVELAETLPATMDTLYLDVFNETKVQRAVFEAEELRKRGKAAAAAGDRAGAERAVAALTALRDRLRQQYSLHVVDREDREPSFWTIPEGNTEATNYYLVVEALDPRGEPLELPIRDETNGEIESVSSWGIRVPENVYLSVEMDRYDDGIIQRNVIGLKQYGFLDVDYGVPVLGGTVTRW